MKDTYKYIVLRILCVILLISPYSVFSQVNDTLYSYEVIDISYSNKDMNKVFYGRESVRLNEKTFEIQDSVSKEIRFESKGKMTFKKFFNGVIYLEGQYDSSDSCKVLIGDVYDPETTKLKMQKANLVFYPRKCGEWKFYINGQLKETLYFNKCN